MSLSSLSSLFSGLPYSPPEASTDCVGCVWEDQCLQTLRCDNYTPVDGWAEEEYTAELFSRDDTYETMMAEYDGIS